jgi:hypothetical protein
VSLEQRTDQRHKLQSRSETLSKGKERKRKRKLHKGKPRWHGSFDFFVRQVL